MEATVTPLCSRLLMVILVALTRGTQARYCGNEIAICKEKANEEARFVTSCMACRCRRGGSFSCVDSEDVCRGDSESCEEELTRVEKEIQTQQVRKRLLLHKRHPEDHIWNVKRHPESRVWNLQRPKKRAAAKRHGIHNIQRLTNSYNNGK